MNDIVQCQSFNCCLVLNCCFDYTVNSNSKPGTLANWTVETYVDSYHITLCIIIQPKREKQMKKLKIKRLLNNIAFKFIARTCFVGIVVSMWSYLLRLESSSKPLKSYSKVDVPNINALVKTFVSISENEKHKESKISHHPIFFEINHVNIPVISNNSALIILSSMRSGSSFLGQLFNQNPSIFYFFEPLFIFEDDCLLDQETKISLLANALNCDFRQFQNHIKNVVVSTTNMLNNETKHKEHLRRRLHNLKKCYETSLCFPSYTESLCRSQKCADYQSCSKCLRNLNRDDVEVQCQSSKLIVIKTVRTCQLNWLKRVRNVAGMHLNVVHLVRDPRAVASSRQKMHQLKGNIVREMQRNCKIDQSIYGEHRHSLGENATFQWNNQNYVLFRYEDILMNPVNSLKFLFGRFNGSWNGIDLLHDDVLDWLKRNTKVSAGSMYSTSRNTTEQMFKWRREISMNLVADIQRVCGEMMKTFGYVSISSAAELQNNSISLVDHPK